MTTTEEKILLAKYAGTISRWCDLTGNVPDVSGVVNKFAVELDAVV